MNAVLIFDINWDSNSTPQSSNCGRETDLKEATLDLVQSSCASHLPAPISECR